MEVKQKEEEIEKLQEALNKLINDAGVRTRQEVCIIYLQCCTNQTSPCCCYRLTYIYDVSFVGGQCQKTVQWENFKTDGGTAHTGNGMSQ